MNRKYEPTEKQLTNWSKFQPPQMPSDEDFKARWAKKHHGKETGWGLEKRQWIITALSCSQDYQMGLWQGRVDAAQGLSYQETQEDKSYNLGYYRGYTEYESDRRGWDAQTRAAFDQKYRVC